MNALPALTLSLLLLLPTQAFSNSEPAEPAQPNLQQLLSELLQNVDMELMLRLQQTLMRNIDLIGPYSQEYFQCVKAEGDFDDSQPLELKELLRQAQQTRNTCQVILDSMFGQMEFDITREEFERGLSPEYRQLLQDSL